MSSRSQRSHTLLLLLLLLLVSNSHSAQPSALEVALHHLQQNTDAYTNDLLQLASIPSISSQPQHLPDVLRAAEWLQARLQRAGFSNAQLLYPPPQPTNSDTKTTTATTTTSSSPQQQQRPAVYASYTSPSNTATILIYGHYDVQPATTADGWSSDPFSPIVKNNAVYGRGVSDNKGGLLAAIQGLESHLQTSGTLPVNVKFLLEGEEEIGSPNLVSFLRHHKELLTADVGISADGDQLSATQPVIVLGLRGQVALELEVTTLAKDVHSGMRGGAVQNAARALTQLLASLYNEKTNAVAVEGFYDNVKPISALDRDDVLHFNFNDDEELIQGLGALEAFGEEKFSTLERLWFRPTLEILGMQSGFSGEGIKTAVPSKSTAKLSARLVPNQEPREILKLLEKHIELHHPPACNVTLKERKFNARPYVIPRDAPSNAAAARALYKTTGIEPLFARRGATIPALAAMQKYLELDTTMFGFALPSDLAHGVNERYLLSQYRVAREAYARLVVELAEELKDRKTATSANISGSSSSGTNKSGGGISSSSEDANRAEL